MTVEVCQYKEFVRKLQTPQTSLLKKVKTIITKHKWKEKERKQFSQNETQIVKTTRKIFWQKTETIKK